MAANASAPALHSPAATSSATPGPASAASSATSAGAVITATSNTIDTSAYAVWRCSGSATRSPHSERIAAGTCGSAAPPTTAPAAMTVTGAPFSAATTTPVSATTCTTAAVRSTRVCPTRSISRPWATAPNAFARPNAPATRPASANEPVASRASSRIARPNMPIGIEPSTDASTGPRAPGSASRAL